MKTTLPLFDNIKVEPTNCNEEDDDCAERVLNGQFTNNLNNFDLNTHGSSAYWYHNGGGSKYASIKITNGTTTNWRVQVVQKGITLQQGHTYTVRFRAKADAYKNIYISTSNAPDNISYGYKSFNIANYWKDYEFTFDMTHATDNNCRLNFSIGGNNTAIRLDDISITKSDCPSSYRYDSTFEDLEADFVTQYKNPFTTNIQLRIKNPIQENAIVSVYNTMGQQILTQEIQTNQDIQIPANNLNNGIYILKVQVGFEEKTYKLLKQ